MQKAGRPLAARDLLRLTIGHETRSRTNAASRSEPVPLRFSCDPIPTGCHESWHPRPRLAHPGWAPGRATLRFCEGAVRRTLRSSVKERPRWGPGTTAALSGSDVMADRHLSRPVATPSAASRPDEGAHCCLQRTGCELQRGTPMSSTRRAVPGDGSLGYLSCPGPGQGGLLVKSLLTEQGDLSAVERFAQFHADADEPLQGRYYSALLPANRPRPRPAARLRGRPRPLLGLQGLRGGLPHPQRARRRRGLARGRAACRRDRSCRCSST